MAITGRAVLLMALGLVPVVLWPSMGTALAWALLTAVLIAVDVALAPSRTTLTLRRHPVDPLRLGEPGSTTLEVGNTGSRRVNALLRDAWQPSSGATGERHRLRLAPGETTTLVTELMPVRRGDRLTDRITVRTLGPLGLAGRQGALQAPGAVRVLPAFPSRKHLPGLLAHLRMLDGRSAVRTRGQGTEFDSLRDYVPGDDVRSIDWRATARRTDVVVRTWRPERDRQIILLLDTSRTSAGRVDDTPRLDAAMDAGLLLAALASRAGDRVDLVAGDRVVRRVSAGGRGAGGRGDRLHEIIGAMADLEPSLLEADWVRLASEALDLAHGRALVVVLTPLEPVVVEETLVPALSALGTRHRVVIASVQDPELDRMADISAAADDDTAGDTAGADVMDGVYESAAAEYALARRRRTSEVLTGLGVTVLDRDPEHLPRDLCDLYLDLKARGLL